MPRREAVATVVVLQGDEVVVSWPLLVEGPVGMGLVDEVSRLQLNAQRFGCSIQLVAASHALVELLGWTGLLEVVPVTDP